MRNARCVVTGDPPFFINSSTIKARCSSNHAMVYTENGTYTAARWRAPHHCTRFPPEAIPLQNWGVLSAAPSSTQTPGNYPKRNTLHLEHGESLQTKETSLLLILVTGWGRFGVNEKSQRPHRESNLLPSWLQRIESTACAILCPKFWSPDSVIKCSNIIDIRFVNLIFVWLRITNTII